MSLSGNLAGITFGGLSSGIDTEGIISRLISIEAQPIQTMQAQQQSLAIKQQALQSLSSKLTALAQAGIALNNPNAFNPILATSSDTTVATISGASGATPGTYNLSVSYLAQAQKVASTAQADTTSALGKSGTFVIDGKSVSVTSSDSLRTIASKINSLGVPAVASLIDGGPGSAYITLTSSATGVANKVQLADASGTVLGDLGVLSGAAAVRESIANGATSSAFTDSTTALGTLLGTNAGGPSSIQVNGVGVAIDLSTDSLQAVADKINSGATGATATVRSVTNNGTTTYKLDITGATTPTFQDAGNVLQSIGVLQQGSGNELVAAHDAQYTLDNVALTSSSNTITTAIPGATLTLLKASSTAPPTSTLTLTQDTSTVATQVHAFADAYNAVVDFVSQNASFDQSTFATGPLFGDSATDQVQSTLSSMLFSNVSGLTGTYTNLASLGFSLDSDGKLQIDDNVLKGAVATSASAVAAVFQSAGQGSTNDISYVSSTTKSKPSGATPYAVNITQLATKGSFEAGTAQTSANPSAETLTFSGGLFGATPYQLTLDVGSTLDATVAKINADSRLKDVIVASNDNGTLKIDSKRYGASGNFTVVSNFAAASNNSGVGVGGSGTTVAGVDVQGTINGEAATGNGQFLTGNTGNATTEGLQIQYTGTALGNVGTIGFSKGIGVQTNDIVGSFTDTVNGLLSLSTQALQSDSDQLQKQIDDLNTYLATRTTDLRQQFAAMETAMAAAQQQSSRLSSLQSSSGG